MLPTPTLSISDARAWRPGLPGLTDEDLLACYHAWIPLLRPDAILVEVGVWAGRSLLYAACRLHELGRVESRIYGVDSWRAPLEEGRQDRCDIPWAAAARCLLSHGRAVELDYIHLVRAESQQAARLWDREQLDLVCLDSDHTHPGTLEAVASWAPRVRRGGIVMGHDWGAAHPGVETAVRMIWPHDRIARHGTVWAVQP